MRKRLTTREAMVYASEMGQKAAMPRTTEGRCTLVVTQRQKRRTRHTKRQLLNFLGQFIELVSYMLGGHLGVTFQIRPGFMPCN